MCAGTCSARRPTSRGVHLSTPTRTWPSRLRRRQVPGTAIYIDTSTYRPGDRPGVVSAQDDAPDLLSELEADGRSGRADGALPHQQLGPGGSGLLLHRPVIVEHGVGVALAVPTSALTGVRPPGGGAAGLLHAAVARRLRAAAHPVAPALSGHPCRKSRPGPGRAGRRSVGWQKKKNEPLGCDRRHKSGPRRWRGCSRVPRRLTWPGRGCAANVPTAITSTKEEHSAGWSGPAAQDPGRGTRPLPAGSARPNAILQTMTATAAAGKEVHHNHAQAHGPAASTGAADRRPSILADHQENQLTWPARGLTRLHNRGPDHRLDLLDDGDRPDLDRSETGLHRRMDWDGTTTYALAEQSRATDDLGPMEGHLLIRHGTDRRGTPHGSGPRTRPSLTPHTSVPAWPEAAGVANSEQRREPMNDTVLDDLGLDSDHRRADGRRTTTPDPRHRRRAGRSFVPGRSGLRRAVRADRRGVRRRRAHSASTCRAQRADRSDRVSAVTVTDPPRPSMALTCRTSRSRTTTTRRQGRRPARRPVPVVSYLRPAGPAAVAALRRAGASRPATHHIGGRGTARPRRRIDVLIVQSAAAGGARAHSPRIAHRPSCRCPSCSPDRRRGRASHHRRGGPTDPRRRDDDRERCAGGHGRHGTAAADRLVRGRPGGRYPPRGRRGRGRRPLRRPGAGGGSGGAGRGSRPGPGRGGRR